MTNQDQLSKLIPLDELRERLTRLMPKLKAPQPGVDRHLASGDCKPGEDFPVPSLVYFVLKVVLGMPCYGPAEKVRWSILFEYDSVPYAVELRKFGFTFEFPIAHPPGTKITDEALGKLKKAVREAEKYLDAFARRQAEDGHVSLENNFHGFKDMYRFLRSEAEKAYSGPSSVPHVEKRPDGSEFTSYTMFQNQRHGGYLACAMTNAYFSWMEHTFLLLLPFTPLRTSHEGLLTFMGAQWGDKFKALFELTTDREAKALFDRMKVVRETWRNPSSHGGILPGHGSLYFHLPQVGAIPAAMTRKPDGFHFLFGPLRSDSFKEVCNLFDEFEAFVRQRLPFGWRFAESGLPVSYDGEMRLEYAQAMTSEETFEAFLDREGYEQDMHANMDY